CQCPGRRNTRKMKMAFKQTVIARLDRAEEAFESGKILFAAGQYNDSISRFYYMMLHLVRALLLTDEVRTKSHRGTQQKFHELYLKQQVLSPDLGASYMNLSRDRDSADYDPKIVFTRAEVEAYFPAIEKFREEIIGLINERLENEE
ncbi:MAG: HEPN domain-containing protein, partial [Bacteroidota bacterium]